MNSTMGAPLTQEEEEAILNAWADLVCVAESLRVGLVTTGPRGEDIVSMLDKASDLIGLVSNLRSTVHNAWYYANKRAWPDPVPQQRTPRRGPKPMTNAEALAELGLTEADYDDLLRRARGE